MGGWEGGSGGGEEVGGLGGQGLTLLNIVRSLRTNINSRNSLLFVFVVGTSWRCYGSSCVKTAVSELPFVSRF